MPVVLLERGIGRNHRGPRAGVANGRRAAAGRIDGEELVTKLLTFAIARREAGDPSTLAAAI